MLGSKPWLWRLWSIDALTTLTTFYPSILGDFLPDIQRSFYGLFLSCHLCYGICWCSEMCYMERWPFFLFMPVSADVEKLVQWMILQHSTYLLELRNVFCGCLYCLVSTRFYFVKWGSLDFCTVSLCPVSADVMMKCVLWVAVPSLYVLYLLALLNMLCGELSSLFMFCISAVLWNVFFEELSCPFMACICWPVSDRVVKFVLCRAFLSLYVLYLLVFRNVFCGNWSCIFMSGICPFVICVDLSRLFCPLSVLWKALVSPYVLYLIVLWNMSPFSLRTVSDL